jgi:hypothetical protein
VFLALILPKASKIKADQLNFFAYRQLTAFLGLAIS